jgi:hypothetical protein
VPSSHFHSLLMLVGSKISDLAFQEFSLSHIHDEAAIFHPVHGIPS